MIYVVIALMSCLSGAPELDATVTSTAWRGLLDAGRFDEARRILDIEARSAPRAALPLFRRGEVEVIVGRPNEALMTFFRAARLAMISREDIAPDAEIGSRGRQLWECGRMLARAQISEELLVTVVMARPVESEWGCPVLPSSASKIGPSLVEVARPQSDLPMITAAGIAGTALALALASHAIARGAASSAAGASDEVSYQAARRTVLGANTISAAALMTAALSSAFGFGYFLSEHAR